MDLDSIIDNLISPIKNINLKSNIKRFIYNINYDTSYILNNLYNDILEDIFNKCISCHKSINVINNSRCCYCKKNMDNFILLKYTNNNLTQTLPIELIYIIQKYI
jgi:hypothetical protein